ncbi:MAG: tRNA pseudouridine(38-40) synthase TruA [Clostridia bacterium]|nr:tRNA pseudouridine(38-40) synthase TruA [Clostridia bacterium]
MRIKLTICYDGTDFCGWQVQPNGRTVQEELENAVLDLTGEKVRVTGSGRTDSGVHAMGQVAHFDTDSDIPPERFCKALNARLPQDVRVIKSERATSDFYSCRGAKRKTYKYFAYLSEIENPLKERYAVRLDKGLDVESMKRACKAFLGEHDFKGFCASGSSIKTTVRTIYALDIDFNGEDLVFTVTGNGFLYNMVRIIVGTLVKVGENKATEADIEKMLATGERALGGKTLLAKGLRLESVVYE